jgi:hypothetical protein
LSERRSGGIMRRMKTKILMGLGAAALLLGIPAGARAQAIRIDFGVQFPGPPPLVVVGSGVQVVPEIDEEVFFVGGWYWVRRDAGWYRARDYRAAWYPAPPQVVPVYLTRAPPGFYRRYYRDDDGRWRGHEDGEYRAWRERHDWHERNEWWRQHRSDAHFRDEQRRSWMDRAKDEPWHRQPPPPRHDDSHRGPDHDRGHDHGDHDHGDHDRGDHDRGGHGHDRKDRH